MIYPFNFFKKRSMKKQNFEPYIFHTKANGGDKKPRVTVVGNVSKNTLLISVARCSGKDQFSKETGRNIAIDRFNKGEIVASVKLSQKDITLSNFIEIAKTVEKEVIENGVHQTIDLHPITTFVALKNN